jgi:hypothetical protein
MAPPGAQALATYEVTGPDGAVYEIEGPEGADSSDILAQIGGRQSAAPPPATPSAGRQAFDRVNRGIGQWFSASPVTGAVELAGQGATALASKSIGGFAGIATLAGNYAGITDADAADVVRGVQESLTYQPRSNSARMIAGAVDKVMHVADPLVAPLERKLDSQNPEIVPAIAATGEAVLDVLPMAQGLKAARGVGAAARVAPSAEALAPARASGSPELSTNPFARESMGAAAAAPTLEGLSPELRAHVETAVQSGRQINRDVLSRHIEADQLPIRMHLTRGQATQDPVQLSVEQNARAKHPEFARLYQEQNQALIDNLDEIRAEISPSVVGQDHIQNGQALIDLYKQVDEPARTEIAAAYKALDDASGGHFPLDAKAFAAQTQKALKEARKSRFLPSSLEGELSDFAGGSRMSFRDFEEMRTTLAAEARKAQRSGDGNMLAAINIMRQNLESIPMSAGTAPLKVLADKARTLARTRFERIEADPAYAAAIDDGVETGAPSPLADTFAEKYVMRGKAAHLDRMRENLSSDPLSQELLAAVPLNYLKRRAGIDLYNNTGNFSQAGFNRALSADVLPRARQLLPPNVSEMIERLGNVARYTQAQPRGHFVNNSNTFTASMGEHVGNVLEGVANVSAGGIPVGTYARKKIAGRAEQRFVRESTAPGAGID